MAVEMAGGDHHPVAPVEVGGPSERRGQHEVASGLRAQNPTASKSPDRSTPDHSNDDAISKPVIQT